MAKNDNRRLFLTNSARFAFPLILPITAIFPSPAHSFIFALLRAAIGNSARRSLRIFSARTLHANRTNRQIGQALAKRRIRSVRMMRNGRNGQDSLPFTETIADLHGDVNFGQTSFGSNNNRNINASIIQMQNSDHKAQCAAFDNEQFSNTTSVMLENPEAISLGPAALWLERKGLKSTEIANILYPIRNIETGKFTYRDGHTEPCIFDTREGNVELSSQVKNSSSTASIRFVPDTRSNYRPFQRKIIL